MQAEFVVTRREPVHDPEAFERAMRILEVGMKRAIAQAGQVRGEQEVAAPNGIAN